MNTANNVQEIIDKSAKKFRHDLRGQVLQALRQMRKQGISISVQDQALEKIVQTFGTMFGASKLIAGTSRWKNYPKFSNKYFTQFKPKEIHQENRANTLLENSLNNAIDRGVRSIDAWMPYLTLNTRKSLLSTMSKDFQHYRVRSSIVYSLMDNEMEFVSIWNQMDRLQDRYVFMMQAMDIDWSQKRIKTFFHAIEKQSNVFLIPRVVKAMHRHYKPTDQIILPLEASMDVVRSSYDDLYEAILNIAWMKKVRDCNHASYATAAAYTIVSMLAFDIQLTNRPGQIELATATVFYKHWDEILDTTILEQQAPVWINVLKHIHTLQQPTVQQIEPIHKILLGRDMTDKEKSMLELGGWDGYATTFYNDTPIVDTTAYDL